MSSPGTDAVRLQRLQGLAERRVKRAMEAVQPARTELDRVRQVRNEQLELIAAMEAQLADVEHSSQGEVLASQLLHASERQRHLRLDLDKERFYLETMQVDVHKARRTLSHALRHLERCRARVDALALLASRRRRKALCHDELAQERLADDAPRQRPQGATRARPEAIA